MWRRVGWRRFLLRHRSKLVLAVPLAALIVLTAVYVSAPGQSKHSAPSRPGQSLTPRVIASPGDQPCCRHWQRTALHAEVDALLTVPNQTGTLLAATPNGVYRSGDAGRTWNLERGADHDAFLALAASPTGATLAAGEANGGIFIRGSAGVWHRIATRLAGGSPIFSLAVSSNGATILAGSVGYLYRGMPVNGQWQWKQVARTNDSSVTAIVFTAGSSPRAYASVFGDTPAVLSSDDEGRTWQPDMRGLPPTLPTVALLASPSSRGEVILTTMGGGVWQRDDNATWHDVAANLPEHHAMPIAAGNAGTLFAGTMGEGVYIRRDTGTWSRLGSELSGAQYTVLSLAFVPGTQPVLLAGTALGLFQMQWTS